MTIFDKVCLRCTASNSVTAARCACGYAFEPENSADPHEEKLYEEYLAARAVQASEAARAAVENATRRPANHLKAAEAAKAKRTAATAKAELAAQRDRVIEAQRAAKTAKDQRNFQASVPRQHNPRIRPIVPFSKPGKPLVAVKSDKRATTARPTVVSLRAKNKTSKKPSTARKETHAGATRASVPRANYRSTRKTRPSKTVAPTAAKTRSSVGLNKAGRVSGVTKRERPKQRRRPGKTFKAAQAAKAADAVTDRTTIETIECLSCTTTIPANTKRCRCGWLVPTAGAELPLLSLSPKDRTTLTGRSRSARGSKHR